MSHNSTERMICLAGAFNEQEVPARFMLLPWGQVRSSKGNFLLDEQAAKQIADAFAARRTEIVVDYEHQSLGGEYARADGKAPAAGWIRQLESVPGVGLFAVVNWTNEGRTDLAAKSYRYFSPVTIVRKSDRRAVAIDSVALTNTPAIAGLTPIVNKLDNDVSEPGDVPAGQGASSTDRKESIMLKKLIEVLALKNADASETDVLQEVTALKSRAEAAGQVEAKLTAVCKSIGVEAGAPVEKIEAHVLVLKNPPDKVPATELATLQTEVQALKAEKTQREAETVFLAAKATGKLGEADREWATKLICADRPTFDAMLEKRPVLYPQGQSTPPKGASSDGPRDRTTLINSARSAFKKEAETAAVLCSERAWVNDALNREGVDLLSDEEVKNLAIRNQ